MTGTRSDQVLQVLGLRAADGAGAPRGGMSGSALVPATTADDEPAMVKVSVFDTRAARDQAFRELAVYTRIAPRYALPTPRLIAHHRAADWMAIALTRHAPAPPAPEWSADDWGAFARTLARVHRDVRPVPHSFRPVSPASAASVGPRHGLEVFAERLWHGPGDRERVRTVLDDLDLLEEAAGSGPVSFVHGDCHVGNVLRTADRRPVLVDWQSARTGASTGDLAFAFTRALPTGAPLPRGHAIAVYCDEAGVDVARTDRQITAHQLLTLVRQYPAFAGLLGSAELDHLRTGLDQLLERWATVRFRG